MAATGYTPIQLYHSTTASAVPVNTDLVNGELAINIADGKLYYKDSGGTVQVIATKGAGTIGGSNTQVQYNSSGALAGSANFTFNGTTATINALNLTNALGAAYGGTAQSTYTQGDLLYASAANTLSKLAIGSNNQVLTSSGTDPVWVSGLNITTLTATQDVTFSATSQNIALGTSQTSGLFTIGGASQTGAIVIGQSTKTQSFSIANGAIESGLTKTINIGTNGDSGSTTNINIGSGSGTITTNFSGTVNVVTANIVGAVTMSATTQNIALGTSQTTGTFTVGGAAQTGTQTFDQSTKTHTLNLGTGATESGLTKTVNIGTGGVSTSTTAITIGSANGTTTTLNGTVTAATLNSTTIDTTNIEVTNIKAKDGTAALSIADSTGAVTVATALTANGGAVFNENGADVDFRVEGDTDANLIFADASTDRVGIGTNAPATKVEISGSHVSLRGLLSLNSAAANISAQTFYINNTYKGAVFADTSDNFNISNITASGALIFNAGSGTERMRLDSSGNLGLGVTPSAWLTWKAMQVGSRAAFVGNSTASFVANNFYYDGADGRYIASATAALYEQSAGTHKFFTAASGTAGNIISFTQAMTLDANGRLLLGTTTGVGNDFFSIRWNSSGTYTQAINIVDANASANGTDVIVFRKSDDVGYGAIGRFSTETSLRINGTTNLVWQTGGTERARITSAGDFELRGGRSIKLYNAANNATSEISSDATGLTQFSHTGVVRWLNATATGTLMTLDASGRLGIGNTSPTFKLDISVTDTTAYSTTAYSFEPVLISNLGAGGVSGLLLQAVSTGTANTAQATISAFAESTSSKDTALAFGTRRNSDGAVLERARITSDGNLLIATTTNPGDRLYTPGSIRAGTFKVDGGAYITGPGSDVLAMYAGSSERARITSGGDFVVGGTSALGTTAGRGNITVNGTSSIVSFGISNSLAGYVLHDGTDFWLNNALSGAMRFYTNGNERARITSGGYFKASNNAAYVGSTDPYHELNTNAADWTAFVRNTNATTPYGLRVFFSGATPNGTGSQFFYCSDSTALRAEIRSNGGIANYSANNVALSDQRVKKDIVAAPSYWDKIKGIEIVLFKYKDQTHDDNNVGVIAQQVEQVAPEFVDPDGWGETPEDGVPLKSIYTSDMYHAAIKALQEAMARIEQLEAKVAVLEGK